MTVADPDGLRKWRESAAEQDEREAHFKKERAREERRTRFESVRNELRAEINAVRDAADQHAEIQIEAVGQALGMLRGEITEQVERVLKDMQTRQRDVEAELFRLVERRFAELAGRIDAIAPDARSRAKGEFQFANERPERDDEPVELPNPLPTRRAIN